MVVERFFPFIFHVLCWKIAKTGVLVSCAEVVTSTTASKTSCSSNLKGWKMPPKVSIAVVKPRNTKKLKKLEKQKEIQRSYLRREIEYGNKTMEKYEKSWRQLLMDISVVSWRKEVEFAGQMFERTMECKDFKISFLMDDLRDAEEDHLEHFSQHVDNIDDLMNSFAVSLKEIKKEQDKQISLLQNRHEEDLAAIQTFSRQEELYAKTVLYGLEQSGLQQEEKTTLDYIFKLDDVRTKSSGNIQRIKDNLERKYQDLWTSSQDFLNTYYQQTSTRRKDHQTLFLQVQTREKQLEKQYNQLNHLNNEVKSLNKLGNDCRRSFNEKLVLLQEENDYLKHALKLFKGKLLENGKTDAEQAMRLTVGFCDVKNYFQSLLDKSNKILQLASICRKLETLKEKILPFPGNLDGVQGNNEFLLPVMTLFWQRSLLVLVLLMSFKGQEGQPE